MAAVLGLTTLLAVRSWTRVRADGVSIYWGIGRSRTYPWREIRWIDVREIESGLGSSVTARITLAEAHRLLLQP